MKIVIVGAGAMGCLFYGFLSRQKQNEVWLLSKKTSLARYIKKNGIKISGKSQIKISPSEINITASAKNIGHADLIIILVKSYNTASAVKKSLPSINEHTTILTLQNGICNLESIKKILSIHFQSDSLPKIFVGTTSHAATPLSLSEIIHCGVGETIIGTDKKDFGAAMKIRKLFENAGLVAKISNNPSSVVWSKLLINAAINPVGGIFNLTNGGILKNEFARAIMIETAKEIARLCKAKKIKLLYSDVVKKVIDVCKKSTANKNSMLQDILRGRTTEIDALNGAILSELKKISLEYKLKTKQIEMPYNGVLYRTIKAAPR